MTRIIFFFAISCFFAFNINLKASNDFSNDTAKINRYIKEIGEIIYNDPFVISGKIDTVLVLSSEANYQFGSYRGHNFKAITLFMTGFYQESINEYRKAMKYADDSIPFQKIRLYSNISLSFKFLNNSDSTLYYLNKTNVESKESGLTDSYFESLLDLGNYYLNKENFVEAAKYFFTVSQVCEEADDQVFIIKAYSNLAMFYKAIGDFDKSYYYFQKAIQEDIDFDGINFLGPNYSNLAELYLRLKNNCDSAAYYFRKGINLTLPYELNVKTMMFHINLGNVFLENEEIDSAFFYYSLAYNDTLLEYYPTNKAAVVTNLGLYYNKKGRLDLGRKYLSEGLSLSEKYELLTFQKNALGELADLEEKAGNPTKALYYHRKFHKVFASIGLNEGQKQLALLEYEKYKVQEQYKNDLLTKENQIQQSQILLQWILIVIFSAVLIGLAIFLIILHKSKQKIAKLNRDLEISQKKLMESNHDLIFQKNEMKELLMSKDKFVSIIGHDLKNPFFGLLGLLEIMSEDWDKISDKEKKSSIQGLYETSIQTYQLLEDILDWGKSQQGLITKKISQIPVHELVDRVIGVYQTSLTKKQLKLKIEIPEDLLILSDRKLSSQILQNFLGNAIKYSNAGQEITIKAEKVENKVLICVVDQGIGIPADKIPQLFSIDSNFNRPGTNSEKSSGMGLILCREYANIIGAELSVKSEVDKGSSFCLIIDNEIPS